MIIKIPKRHSKYIDAIHQACNYKKKENLIVLFNRGMNNVVEDLNMGAGEFPPDMDKNLLRGKKIELEIPYELSEDETNIIESIRKHFKVNRDTILMTFFLMGLFNQWSLLRRSDHYQKDIKFKKLVDEMPHDLFDEGMFDEEDHNNAHDESQS